ncbi:MAG: glycosyl transferase family 36 [Acidobacteria bacterium]|nr:glycosyl transferase family 36 [Acidobacteriota bacterium]
MSTHRESHDGNVSIPRFLQPGRYGHFAANGTEYRITDPRPPRPWVNVIANPRLGLVVSHTGSGFTWIDNSQLAVLTNWRQDFAQDSSGKFLYLRDAASGRAWSLSPAPTWPRYDRFACRHGIGFTTFETLFDGIEAHWTLFCDPVEPVELWRVELAERSGRGRTLQACAFLEWCCGLAPAPRREFHKLFIETWCDEERRAVFARNHMWDLPSPRWGHWNTDFRYVAALGGTEPLDGAQGDKAAFTGRYRDLAAPEALDAERWTPRFGRHEDPVAALRSTVELPAGGTRVFGYALAVGESTGAARELLARMTRPGEIEASLARARGAWDERLAAHRIATPEPELDTLVNDWTRYQAISARIFGRCGYYQQSGAYGFRDQLQDSQVWLTIDPARCRSQIGLHAAHQFADGSVYHWWHPLSEQGHVTRMTDDLLWLAFVTAAYLRETGDFSVLEDRAPFLDDSAPASLAEHVDRAFTRVFGRTSPRGLPYIGAGDWNDGLSAAGLEERGESVWLAHFLAGLLAEWAEIHRRTGGTERAADFEQRRAALVAAINQHAWDGRWYIRGTLDDGTPFGSAANAAGQVYLNAQTWAVLNDVAPPERARACMEAVRERLVTDAGALLVAPAYREPVREIGYITRYAPGMRENGGVYTHAAVWAIAAACKSGDAELAGRLVRALNPALKDPERYWAEPYVLPGNVDGPDSPYPGRGGWTWYTGSAAWFHRVVCEWVLGVRPEWDGLRIAPCLPPDWGSASMVRPYRAAVYEIRFTRQATAGQVRVALDGQPLAGTLVPPPRGPGRHVVEVLF